jgi:hypothetical protein
LLDKVILQVSPIPTNSKKQEGAEVIPSGQADASGSLDTPAVTFRGLGGPKHEGALNNGSEKKETGVVLQRLDITSLGGHLGGSPENISKGADSFPEKKQPGDRAKGQKSGSLGIRKGSGRAVADRADVKSAEKNHLRFEEAVQLTRSSGSRSKEASSVGNTLQSPLALSGPEVETVRCEESSTSSAGSFEEPRGALAASEHPKLKQDTDRVELVETAEEPLSLEENLAVLGELGSALRVWDEEEAATGFQSSPGLAESLPNDQGPSGGLSEPFVFLKVNPTVSPETEIQWYYLVSF